MKREKLIEELKKLPEGIEICVFDWRKNLNGDYGDGSGIGIYPDIEIELMNKAKIAKNSEIFASINFENDDYDEYGKFIER